MFLRFLIVPVALVIFAGLLLYAIIHNTRKLIKPHNRKGKWLNIVGLLIPIAIIATIAYGFTLGFAELRVVHADFTFKQLPKSFDGYKIVMFTDAHVGTFNSRPHLLQRDVDSINAQHADAIVFCGDIENISPNELEPFRELLTSLKANDGVFSVFGNHDYSLYMPDATEEEKSAMLQKTKDTERSFGWHLLLNENMVIRRGNDSIFIAGEENDGNPPFPRRADAKKTMHGIHHDDFTIMLQHDPTAWRRQVLPQTTAQLTLSGHTHAGQISILGYSLTQGLYPENRGAYREGNRHLYVSSGLGGIVPFRLGMPAEIVVITLHTTHI